VRPDRATKRFVQQLADLGLLPLDHRDPEHLTSVSRVISTINGSGPSMARVEDHEVDGVTLRVLIPTDRPRGIVVYYHAGGWLTATNAAAEPVVRKLAERTSCIFVLVEQRRVPALDHAASIEDSHRALLWAADRARDLAGGDVPLMVAGEGAGGNLAALMTQRARDDGAPHLSLQILVCPLLGPELEDLPAEADLETLLTPAGLQAFWEQSLPEAAGMVKASPFRAMLEGLPPAVVITAEHDPARSQGERYAQRLRRAGVDVDARCYDGQLHGFVSVLMLPIGERAFQQIIRAVRACAVHFDAGGPECLTP
jgi:acetyl esterase